MGDSREAPEMSAAGGAFEAIELGQTSSSEPPPASKIVNSSDSARQSPQSSDFTGSRCSKCSSKLSLRSLWSHRKCICCRLFSVLLLEGLILTVLALTLVLLLNTYGIGGGDDLLALRSDVRAMRSELAQAGGDDSGAEKVAEEHSSLSRVCANLSALDALLADCSADGRQRALGLLAPFETQLANGRDIYSRDCVLRLVAAR